MCDCVLCAAHMHTNDHIEYTHHATHEISARSVCGRDALDGTSDVGSRRQRAASSERLLLDLWGQCGDIVVCSDIHATPHQLAIEAVRVRPWQPTCQRL